MGKRGKSIDAPLCRRCLRMLAPYFSSSEIADTDESCAWCEKNKADAIFSLWIRRDIVRTNVR